MYEYKPYECGTVNAKTLTVAPAKKIEPRGTECPVVIKVPVVLAEQEIQIDVEACIDIKDNFFEIKRIKKNVTLVQCKLIPNAGQKDRDGKPISGKLFIKGFVEKNIEYATLEKCEYADVKSGYIKHATARVPFHAVTEVYFETAPIFRFRKQAKEFDFFRQSCDKNDECADNLGKSLCETGFEEEIFFIEKPFCNLEEAKIIEIDISKEDIDYECKEEEKDLMEKVQKHDPCEDKMNYKVKKFSKIIEKMVIFLKVKVLQEQQVKVN